MTDLRHVAPFLSVESDAWAHGGHRAYAVHISQNTTRHDLPGETDAQNW
jgi:hypothetical protein